MVCGQPASNRTAGIEPCRPQRVDACNIRRRVVPGRRPLAERGTYIGCVGPQSRLTIDRMRNRPLRSESLALLPYPEGRGFAFTIIDDTDGETLETVSPIYDELSELGLRTTKTVWVRAPRIPPSRSCDAGDTLERPEYTSYLRSLQSRGFE